MIVLTHKFTKRFHNCFDKLYKLNYLERFLIDWLAEEMDEDNEVATMERDRLRFINFMLKISIMAGDEKVYKDSTIKTSLNRLKNVGLLITPIDKRGWCWVNPMYYHKGSPDKRKNMVRYIEDKVGALV